MNIKVDSGVSWLHDRLRKDLEDREQAILEGLGRDLDYASYIKTNGRLHENRRQQMELRELFKEFYQFDDEGDDDDG